MGRNAGLRLSSMIAFNSCRTRHCARSKPFRIARKDRERILGSVRIAEFSRRTIDARRHATAEIGRARAARAFGDDAAGIFPAQKPRRERRIGQERHLLVMAQLGQIGIGAPDRVESAEAHQ